MPYVSDAQRRWAHTDTGIKALGGKDKVREWDNASRGKKLPERVKKAVEQQAVATALQTYGLSKQAVSDEWLKERIRNGFNTRSNQGFNRNTAERAGRIAELLHLRKTRQEMQGAHAAHSTTKAIPHLKADPQHAWLSPLAMGLGGLGIASAGYGLYRHLSKPKQEQQPQPYKQAELLTPALLAGLGLSQGATTLHELKYKKYPKWDIATRALLGGALP